MPSQSDLRTQTITVGPGAIFNKARMAAIKYLQLVSSRIKLSENQTKQKLSVLIKFQRPPREALEALQHIFPWATSFAIKTITDIKKRPAQATGRLYFIILSRYLESVFLTHQLHP